MKAIVYHNRILALVLAVLAFTAPSAQAQPAAPVPVAAAGIDRRVGAPLPLAVRFDSSTGQNVALGDIIGRGKPALLVLAYNRCTMLCSLVLRRLARLVPELQLEPGDDYALVTLSIDPRDNVFEASRLQASLLDAAGLPGQTERWSFLVGERPAIDAVASAVGFRYVWDAATQQYSHPAVLIAITPQGAVSAYFDGLDPNPVRVREALVGGPSVVRVVEQVLSNCFRFDTAHSRYGSALTWLLRGLALSVSVGLGFLLWRLSRSHRRGPAGGPS